MRSLLVAFALILTFGVHAQVRQLAGLNYIQHDGNGRAAKPPIVILVHGYGSNENDLFDLVNRLPAHYRVISLRAPIDLGSSSYAWYNIDRTEGKVKYNSTEVLVARRQLVRFVKAIKYKYKTEDVFLLGFSQGAIMSLDVALVNPGLVKGVMALSGRMLSETSNEAQTGEATKKLSVFMAHGIKDEMIPIFNGREAQAYCREFGVKLTYKEYPIGHQTSDQELIDLVNWLRPLTVH